MNQYLADTTVLVEVLRKNLMAKKFLEGLPEISSVTFVELIQGCHSKRDLAIAEKICEPLTQIRIDREVSDFAIELLRIYHLSHGLIFFDALIAATCILRKKILITENVKDFRFITGLEVISQKKAFAAI